MQYVLIDFIGVFISLSMGEKLGSMVELFREMGDLSPEKGDLSLLFIEEKLLLEVGYYCGS